ncbi:MFS general substrate transporter [Hypoxylon sp. FL1284]|nr:MFS general substrate transporter [Hypoxylon sp. FL1284]
MTRDTTGDDEITATERTPLVGDGPEDAASAWKPGHSRSSTLASVASLGSVNVATARKPGAVLGIFCFIIFFASAAGAFLTIPMTRVYEDILCHEYYGRTPGVGEPIDEEACKVDVVQSRLAYLLAVLESLNAGLSCLVVLLWGSVADRIGRKPVFALSSAGFILYVLLIMAVGWFSAVLPVRLVWVSSVAHLLGGQPAMIATMYSMLSDVIPESKRSISFMRIHITSMVGNLISPALASGMMTSTGPWPVLLVTLGLYIIPVSSVALIPETFHPSRRSVSFDNDGNDPQHVTMKARALRAFSQLKDLLSIIRIRALVLILCICLLSLPVLLCTFQFMVQFISKRYHIPIAETGYVQSLYGVAHIIVMLLIIPFISGFITRPTLPRWLRVADEKRRDLVLARWSFAAYVAGTFLLAVAPTLAVFIAGLLVMSLGSGSASLVKSIATSHVDPEHLSRFFSLLALVEMTSSIWSTPALAGLFALGMRLGGEWIGLPYLGVSLTCLAMLVLSLFLQPPANDRDDVESTPDYGSGSSSE